MANKRTRKQKQRATSRRPVVPGAASAGLLDIPSIDDTVAADEAAAAETADAETADAETADALVAPAVVTPASTSASQGRRRVARINASLPAAPERRLQRGQPAGFIAPLESEDAAIPFDRVPYVPADLRRVAIMAAVMVVLIIVADIIVSNVVS